MHKKKQWLKGCLPTSLGGGDDYDDNYSDLPPEELTPEQLKRRAAAANLIKGPIIRLVPLDSATSAVLEGVMNDNSSGDVGAEDMEIDNTNSNTNNTMHVPKLKEEYQNDKSSSNTNDNVCLSLSCLQIRKSSKISSRQNKDMYLDILYRGIGRS